MMTGRRWVRVAALMGIAAIGIAFHLWFALGGDALDADRALVLLMAESFAAGDGSLAVGAFSRLMAQPRIDGPIAATLVARSICNDLERRILSSLSRITDLLVGKYGVEREKASPESTMADLGLDSLNVAELLFDVEDEFSIEIEMSEAEEMRTLADAASIVDRLRAAQRADS